MSVRERAGSRWLRRFAAQVAGRVIEDSVVLGMWGTAATGKTALVAALAAGVPVAAWDRRPARALAHLFGTGVATRKDREALGRLLQRLAELRRRVDAWRAGRPTRSAVRIEFRVRTSRPPGRALVSSRHVTRGPDVPRTTPAMVVRG
ncbi:hypothetical protein GCM10010492_41440 [Saccharothrix mutabilis subsp. mutabilis]|uniref:vWA-MoxR associated protein C-terminal domain-containing protein n=2 Tax=Saccharothrix mutabilis TaxID=33921 RepID=A0ABN0U436_9PSEU